MACTLYGRRRSQERFVDTSPWVKKLHEDLLAVFQADVDVQIVGVSKEFPF